MSYRRIFYQIFVSFFVILLLALVAVTWYTRDLAKNFYIRDTSQNLKSIANLIAAQTKDNLRSQKYDTIKRKINELGRATDIRITIVLPDGLVVADSEEEPAVMDNHIRRPEVQEALHNGVGKSIRYSNTIEMNLMYVAIPLYRQNELLAIVRTSLPIEDIETTLQHIQNRILLGGLVVALFTALFGLFVSRRISKPLEDMTRGVEYFTKGELDYRLPVPKNKEINRLASELNAMARQLSEKIQTIEFQKNEQQAVLQSMAEGVLAVDGEEKIIMLNTAARNLLGVDGGTAEGSYIQEVIRNTQLQKIISQTLNTGRLLEDEIILRKEEVFYVQVHGNILQDESGATIGALVVLNDVTRIRRLEKIRRDFVANVSHEIRTPLTSIKGFVETLSEGAIDNPGTARQFLEIIRKQTDRLNAIIDDLMALANLEQDEERADVQFEEREIEGVMQSAVQICKPGADEKGITIRIKCTSDIRFRMNPMLVEQALVNLLQNAVKYSPENTGIEVLCESTENEICIAVKDEGIGIPKDSLTRIFERFYRVDRARSRKLGGTGLGLAIVKHIVRVHEGRVEVQSRVGQGSTFYLYFPTDADKSLRLDT